MPSFATISPFGFGILVDVDAVTGEVIRSSIRRAHPGCTIQWMPERGNGSPITAIGKGGAVLSFSRDPDKLGPEFASTFEAQFCETKDELEQMVADVAAKGAAFKADAEKCTSWSALRALAKGRGIPQTEVVRLGEALGVLSTVDDHSDDLSSNRAW